MFQHSLSAHVGQQQLWNREAIPAIGGVHVTPLRTMMCAHVALQAQNLTKKTFTKPKSVINNVVQCTLRY